MNKFLTELKNGFGVLIGIIFIVIGVIGLFLPIIPGLLMIGLGLYLIGGKYLINKLTIRFKLCTTNNILKKLLF